MMCCLSVCLYVCLTMQRHMKVLAYNLGHVHQGPTQCVNWTIVGELSSLEGERNKGSTEEVIFPFWLNDCISTFQEWKRDIYYTLRKTIRENDVLFCSCIYSVYLMYIYVWDIPAHIIYFLCFFFASVMQMFIITFVPVYISLSLFHPHLQNITLFHCEY